MNEVTKRNIELGLAWLCPIFVLGYLVSWCILGGNLPPPNMLAMSGAELVSEFYGPNKNTIAAGNIAAASFGMLYLPWSCLLGYMLRDEDGGISVFGLLVITGGALTAWVISMAPAMWAACAIFSQNIDPEIIKFAHVLTWCVFDTTYMVTTVQLTGLGLYIVCNKKQTIFPSWCGWLAFLVAYLFVALVLIPFVSKGIFAVGGVFNFWLQLVTWLASMSCFTYFMIKSLYRQRQVLVSALPNPSY